MPKYFRIWLDPTGRRQALFDRIPATIRRLPKGTVTDQDIADLYRDYALLKRELGQTYDNGSILHHIRQLEKMHRVYKRILLRMGLYQG